MKNIASFHRRPIIRSSKSLSDCTDCIIDNGGGDVSAKPVNSCLGLAAHRAGVRQYSSMSHIDHVTDGHTKTAKRVVLKWSSDAHRVVKWLTTPVLLILYCQTCIAIVGVQIPRSITRLLDKIETKFQRLFAHSFDIIHSNGTSSKPARCNCGTQLSNKNTDNVVRLYGKKPEVENPIWRPPNFKFVKIKYKCIVNMCIESSYQLSNCWNVSIGSVVAILNFRPHILSGISAEVQIWLESCIQAEIHVISNLFPVTAAICDLQLTLTSHSNRTISVFLSDPKNVG